MEIESVYVINSLRTLQEPASWRKQGRLRRAGGELGAAPVGHEAWCNNWADLLAGRLEVNGKVGFYFARKWARITI